MNRRKQNIVDPLKWETTILPLRRAGSWDKGFPTVYPGMTVQGHTGALGSRLVQLKVYVCANYRCSQECVLGCGVCCCTLHFRMLDVHQTIHRRCFL